MGSIRDRQAQKSRLSQRPAAASSPDFAADLRSSPDIDMSLVRGRTLNARAEHLVLST